MSEKHWYQNGRTMVCAAVGLIVLLYAYQDFKRGAEWEARPTIQPNVHGHLENAIFGTPTLVITVWHESPGTVSDAVLIVTINEDPSRSQASASVQQRGLVGWKPNRENAVSFRFPLKQYDPKHAIKFNLALMGRTIKQTFVDDEWQGTGWKSNREK